MALIAITWAILLLSILAIGIMQVMQVSSRSVTAAEEKIKDELFLESALDLFISSIFYQPGSQLYREGSFILFEKQVDVTVSYEDGRIDLNRASFPLLSASFASQGVGEQKSRSLAAAIIDWRDSNTDVHEYGAESGEYDAADLTYGPRNGAFASVGELTQVIGMEPEYFICGLPLFTVYGRSSAVELIFASDAVRDVFEWASNSNWEGETWPDVLAETEGQSVVDLQETLGGQGLRVQFTFTSFGKRKTYEVLLRYKSTADFSYRRLSGFRHVLENPADTQCQSSL
ncbi:general secretion pathway protein GspK [Kordiimonas sp. SCSIO 12603]|uniref:general secretion pathway protein GspK n=1 Tax=Kordiimonas sp. SCSIO 12603 TaxID=2829596 RepID=UPI002103EC21|nr:type II secretion system protein GspK [Kordiimonas sp. SCSIO 12603]UTW58730.1 general secretion pathway protein GspK [Kordiimonas sp. SCSIO 12603]